MSPADECHNLLSQQRLAVFNVWWYSCQSRLASCFLLSLHRSSSSGPHTCCRVCIFSLHFHTSAPILWFVLCATIRVSTQVTAQLVVFISQWLLTWFHFSSRKNSSVFPSRPAFLPDPNDGSLYSLGGKNNEGLTVRGNYFISTTILFSTLTHHLASCSVENGKKKHGLLLICNFCAAELYLKSHLTLFLFVCRNCLLPSQSWCKHLPVAVQTESSTWVRCVDHVLSPQEVSVPAMTCSH